MVKQKPQLIITTGRPAAGKSTLAKLLSKELGIPLFSKDNIREVLFASVGWKDRKWAQVLGRASIDILFYLAEMQLGAGCSVILDNSFDPALSVPRFQALKTKYEAEIIQVVCNADQETLFARFRERAEFGNRHPGHGDHEVLEDLRAHLAEEKSMVMDLGGSIIEVNTTDFAKIDYSAILNELRLAMQK